MPSSVNECIIFRKKFDAKSLVGKHRDRAYDCTTSVIRELHGDVEIVILKDEDTYWMEGINSEGICVINSSLIVGTDEKEKVFVKKTGKRFKDGAKIKHALKLKNIKDVVNSLMKYRGGVKGHIIVTNGSETYTIESQSNFDSKITKKIENEDNPIVRTNHGYEHGQAGYSDGDDFMSSAIRRDQMTKNLEKIDANDDVISIFDKISKSRFGEKSPFNIVRNTDHMRTTSQMLLIPQELGFYLKIINGEFGGIHDHTPEDHDPIINIDIIE